jgi:hypothetical protein
MMSGIRPPLPAAALARSREYVFHAHELVGEASGNRGVTRTVLWMRSMEERGALVSYGPSVHSRGAPVSIVVAAQISTRVASVVGRSGILDHLPQHLMLCYRVTLLKSLERSFCCDRDNHISRAVDGVDLSQVPFCGMWLVALRPWPLSVVPLFSALFCLRSARHVVTMQIRQAINTQEAGPIIYLGRSRQPSEGHLFHSMHARDSFLHTNRCRIAELIVLGS